MVLTSSASLQFSDSEFQTVSKQCIAVSINLAFTATGNSHATWDHTVLPATWQRCESHLYPLPWRRYSI